MLLSVAIAPAKDNVTLNSNGKTTAKYN